jgi:hypothetical protein
MKLVGSTDQVLSAFLAGESPRQTAAAPVPGGRRLQWRELGGGARELVSYRSVIAEARNGHVYVVTRTFSHSSVNVLHRLLRLLALEGYVPKESATVIRSAVPGRWGGYGPAWHATGYEDIPTILYTKGGSE